MKARFSVSSYSFHGLFYAGAFDLFGYFESMKYRYHLDTADIWNGMLRSYDEDYLKMLRLQMDERGLELVNLCCDGANIWCADADEGAKFDATAAACLRAAETLGARSVRMDVGIKEKAFTDQQVEAVARKYYAYCAQAARFGARLGPENHWGASTNIDFMRRLFEAV
ncbi:MAG: TIM barrel protein, partial [Candidatus Spyradocola sp.]